MWWSAPEICFVAVLQTDTASAMLQPSRCVPDSRWFCWMSSCWWQTHSSVNIFLNHPLSPFHLWLSFPSGLDRCSYQILLTVMICPMHSLCPAQLIIWLWVKNMELLSAYTCLVYRTDLHSHVHAWTYKPQKHMWKLIQEFPSSVVRLRTASSTAFCHYVLWYRYLVRQSNEFCSHNPLCCFSGGVHCCAL
jgi:hypothetical protein